MYFTEFSISYPFQLCFQSQSVPKEIAVGMKIDLNRILKPTVNKKQQKKISPSTAFKIFHYLWDFLHYMSQTM